MSWFLLIHSTKFHLSFCMNQKNAQETFFRELIYVFCQFQIIPRENMHN